MQNFHQVSHTLSTEASLHNNQFLKSASGRFYARVQDDGNFVMYNSADFQSKNAFWASQSSGKGKGPYYLKMQKDGNLVLYDSHNQAVWASNTWNKGTAPYKLVMQNDRNLVIYDNSNNAIWASDTHVDVTEDTLGHEQTMDQHAVLISKNNAYFARLQDDGNFVCYNGTSFTSQNAFWSSNSYGKGKAPYRLIAQNDGNLCIYDKDNTCTWSSNTYQKGTGPFKLVMQNDRNLCLYDSHGTCTWSSNTYTSENPNSTNTNQYNANTFNTNDTIEHDHALNQNHNLVSKNNKYHARVQDDGNFVCYSSTDFSSKNAFWASNTGGIGSAPFKLVPQNDGNLCLYDSTGKATWSSNTWHKGTGPYRLVMQNDRNLVLYDSKNQAIWASGTNI